MSLIYLLTCGEYSDYGVVAVFDSRELAEAAMDGKSEDYRIEEYPLNPGLAEYHAGRRVFYVEMLADGTVHRTDDFGWAWAKDFDPPHVTYQFGPFSSGHPMAVVRFVMDTHVWATDQAHAIKIANEQRAQLLASGQWAEQEQAHRIRFTKTHTEVVC